jgi:hypothetical protein
MINTIVDNKYGCLGWVGWLFVVVFTKKYSLKRPFSAKILAFSWDFFLQRHIF